jgi:hypothetical protein
LDPRRTKDLPRDIIVYHRSAQLWLMGGLEVSTLKLDRPLPAISAQYSAWEPILLILTTFALCRVIDTST